MKAMILAAGLGSRLKPITDKLPKPLIDVGGISLIERSINQLISFGVNQLIINVSYLGDQIKEALKSTDAISKIIFIDEPFPYGTGGALVNAKNFLGNDPFILSTADIVFDSSFNQLPSTVEAAHLVAVKNPEHNQRGDFSMRTNTVFINDGMNDFGQFQSLAMNFGINRVENGQDFNIPDVVKSRLIANKALNEYWLTQHGKKISLIKSIILSDSL